jgi:hypothetical protein
MSEHTRVFVIAGTNTQALAAMLELLRAMGLKAIGWSDAESAAAPETSTAAVVNAGMSAAGATVVLFTGDDEVRLRREFRRGGDAGVDATFRVQARPNVLFEAGMAYMKDPKNTLFVVCGQQKIHDEVTGLNRMDVDDDPQWRQALATRLREAGLSVVDDSSAWAQAGDFSSAIPVYEGTPREVLVITSELPISKEQLVILRSALHHEGFFQLRDIVEWLGSSPAKARFHADELAINGYLDKDDSNRMSVLYRMTHEALKLLNHHELLS